MYGQGSVKGEVVTDKICYTKGSLNCVDNVKFLAVTNAGEINNDKYGGLVGLA